MPDPYVLSLLAASTPCFGHISLPDPECDKCDIKDVCFKAYIRKASIEPSIVEDLPFPPTTEDGSFLPPQMGDEDKEDLSALFDKMIQKESEKKSPGAKNPAVVKKEPVTIRFDETNPISLGIKNIVVDFETISSALSFFQKRTDLRDHPVDDIGKRDDYLVED